MVCEHVKMVCEGDVWFVKVMGCNVKVMGWCVKVLGRFVKYLM